MLNINNIFSTSEQITCLSITKNFIFIGMMTGDLLVLNRENNIPVSIPIKSTILCADQFEDLVLVGTVNGLYEINFHKQQFVQIFKKITKVSNIKIVNKQQAIISALSQPKFPILPEKSQNRYYQMVPCYKTYLLHLPKQFIVSETENYASGGLFQYYKDEVLIPLNTLVEPYCYVVYKLKNNRLFMARSGKLFGLDGGQPVSCCINDAQTIVSFQKHSNFYTNDLVCQKEQLVFQADDEVLIYADNQIKFNKKLCDIGECSFIAAIKEAFVAVVREGKMNHVLVGE